jgi:hypothetical protein
MHVDTLRLTAYSQSLARKQSVVFAAAKCAKLQNGAGIAGKPRFRPRKRPDRLIKVTMAGPGRVVPSILGCFAVKTELSRAKLSYKGRLYVQSF